MENFISHRLGFLTMNKQQLHTTLSSKHWELLRKHTKKFETQQKVLEAALESLEKNSNGDQELSPLDKLWMRMKDLRQNLCFIHKEVLKELIRTADFEQFSKLSIRLKLLELQVTFYCQKPLKECSLKEVMEAFVQTSKIRNFMDAMSYTDCGDYYSLEVVYTLGTGNTDVIKSFKLIIQDLFETYGVKTEWRISQNSLFAKIYKKP